MLLPSRLNRARIFQMSGRLGDSKKFVPRIGLPKPKLIAKEFPVPNAVDAAIQQSNPLIIPVSASNTQLNPSITLPNVPNTGKEILTPLLIRPVLPRTPLDAKPAAPLRAATLAITRPAESVHLPIPALARNAISTISESSPRPTILQPPSIPKLITIRASTIELPPTVPLIPMFLDEENQAKDMPSSSTSKPIVKKGSSRIRKVADDEVSKAKAVRKPRVRKVTTGAAAADLSMRQRSNSVSDSEQLERDSNMVTSGDVVLSGRQIRQNKMKARRKFKKDHAASTLSSVGTGLSINDVDDVYVPVDGEEVDWGKVTMASICDESVQWGRESGKSNEIKKEHLRQMKGELKDSDKKELLRMKWEWEHRMQGIKAEPVGETDDIIPEPEQVDKEEEMYLAPFREDTSMHNEKEDDDSDDDPTNDSSRHAVQMRMINGQLVIDQNSLSRDRAAEADELIRGYDMMDEGQYKFTNSTSYSRRVASARWSADETEKFYQSINQFGTDFEMIARLFPGRSRSMIKNKWRKEEKHNSALITSALMRRTPIDVKAYEEATQLDLSGPTPIITAPAAPDYQNVKGNDTATEGYESDAGLSEKSLAPTKEYTEDGLEIVEVTDHMPGAGQPKKKQKLQKGRKPKGRLIQEPNVQIIGHFR